MNTWNVIGASGLLVAVTLVVWACFIWEGLYSVRRYWKRNVSLTDYLKYLAAANLGELSTARRIMRKYQDMEPAAEPIVR